MFLLSSHASFVPTFATVNVKPRVPVGSKNACVFARPLRVDLLMRSDCVRTLLSCSRRDICDIDETQNKQLNNYRIKCHLCGHVF